MFPPAPFDLRFVIPVQPLIVDDEITKLVPFDAPAYLPLDTTGQLPVFLYHQFTKIERQKCAELKTLAQRFQTDVIHFVVGFTLADYENGASSDILRRHLVRETVWSLIRSTLLENDADEVDSLVAMHLDCEMPHVHVAMSRYASKGKAVKKLIKTLPAALLPLN